MAVTLGRYELLQRCASGGMAEIFVARATGPHGFEKRVVVKCIHPELAGDQDVVKLFFDEARIAASLQHENIVQVFDVGLAEGRPYLAMELLDGCDVRQITKAARARGDRVPAPDILSILIGVARGLAHVHGKRSPDGQPLGIVHRDVSPQNVFVTREGGVKLLDFGIAKAAHRLAVTRSGVLRGKVQYMSPEQCRGEPADARSDLYAACVMLWELVTGRALWQGEDEFAIMKDIVERDPPRPSDVAPGCSPDIERTVVRGLARAPDERYQTAEELLHDLEAAAAPLGRAVSPTALARYVEGLIGETQPAGGTTPSPYLALQVPSEPHGTLPTVAEPLSGRRASRRRRLLIAVGAFIGGLALAVVGWRLLPPGGAARRAPAVDAAAAVRLAPDAPIARPIPDAAPAAPPADAARRVAPPPRRPRRDAGAARPGGLDDPLP